VMVLYSDGITERGNPEGDLYGLPRLVQAARLSRRDPARIAVYSILGDVQGWSRGTPAEDDATLIVARIR
jgi:serine phosphatase RsbU (regulator of sigma subunit)